MTIDVVIDNVECQYRGLLSFDLKYIVQTIIKLSDHIESTVGERTSNMVEISYY